MDDGIGKTVSLGRKNNDDNDDDVYGDCFKHNYFETSLELNFRPLEFPWGDIHHATILFCYTDVLLDNPAVDGVIF